MKEELERIWREEPIAWPCNMAKWSEAAPNKFSRVVKRIGNLFTRKGKRYRIRK